MKFRIFYFLLSFACIFLLSCRQEPDERSVSGESSADTDSAIIPQITIKQDIVRPLTEPHFGLAILADNDVAFALDTNKVTWREFKDAIYKQVNLADIRSLSEAQVNLVQKVVFNSLRKRILLNNAKRDGFSVSRADQEALDAIIQKQLAIQPDGLTLEQYLAKFPPNANSFLQLSRAEMYLLMKYTREMTKDIAVTDDEISILVAQAKQVYANLNKQNKQLRQDLEDLLKLPEIKTDKGFADLAQAHSQGREANRGGELNVYFTRKELAEANDDQEITITVGENTAVIETSSAYRIIRLLAEMPPEEPGLDARYKIAQILQMKYAEEEMPGSEDLRRSLQYQKEEERIQNLTLQSIVDHKVSCPLFPLWDVRKGI